MSERSGGLELVPGYHGRRVCLRDALQEKSRTILRDIEPKLDVGALNVEFRRLLVEKEVGSLNSQPALRFVSNQPAKLTRGLGRFQSQKKQRLDRVLKLSDSPSSWAASSNSPEKMG